jgi:hypothetical protein
MGESVMQSWRRLLLMYLDVTFWSNLCRFVALVKSSARGRRRSREPCYDGAIYKHILVYPLSGIRKEDLGREVNIPMNQHQERRCSALEWPVSSIVDLSHLGDVHFLAMAEGEYYKVDYDESRIIDMRQDTKSREVNRTGSKTEI